MPSCPMALSVSVLFLLYIMISTWAGRAFCCLGFGSLLRKARKSLDRILPTSSSSSFVGFGRSFSLKDEDTNEMALLIVLSARGASDRREKRPLRRAMANAPMSLILFGLEKPSRKTSFSSPTDLQYFSHLAHVLSWSSCVFPVTASLRAASAAQISDMS